LKSASITTATDTELKTVLNVGGNSKAIELPKVYQGWEHVLLDIDPKGNPDIVCDARQLTTLPASQYDAVYCSHNLEHYHRHDALKVLAGFRHVLKPNGFVQIRVPDMDELIQIVAERNLDIEDAVFNGPGGPVLVRDVIYGYGLEIERSGNDFFAHKTGFTPKSLVKILESSGFPIVFTALSNLEIDAIAFTREPDAGSRALLELPEP